LKLQNVPAEKIRLKPSMEVEKEGTNQVKNNLTEHQEGIEIGEINFNIREVQKPKFLEAPIHSFDNGANRKRIIAVSSSGKGGTGKSTTAMMLALFYQELNQNTVLIDLDIPFGDIANMLGMSTERCISDFVGIPKDLSDTKIRENMLLTYHNGLKVLPALRDLKDLHKVNSAAFVDDLLEHLESFSTIIIDLGPNFEPVTVRALEKATEIVYVTDDYDTTFHNIYHGKQVLKEMGIDVRKMFLVINKSISRNQKEEEIRAINAKNITGIEKVFFFPMVIEMPKLVDSSSYLVLEKQRHPYRKAIYRLIQELSPELFTSKKVAHEKTTEGKRRGLFSWFGGKK
jgi:MinD-like ATPase involved in chromosome partitioning or flagellar assembly